MSGLLTPPQRVEAVDPSGPSEPDRRRQLVRIAALVAFWFIAVIFTLILIGRDEIPAGTTVAGVDIGGLDKDAAVSKLEASLQKRASNPIMLSFGDTQASVEPSALGLSLNASATVDSVMTSRLNPFDLFSELFGGGESVPVVRLDAAALYPQLDVLSAKYSRPMTEPEITYEGTTPVLAKATSGSLLDKSIADDAILAGYLQTTDPIKLPMTDQQPTVDIQAAQAVEDSFAKSAVSEPITMKVGDVVTEISPNDLAANLTFRVSDGQLKPVVDGAGLHDALADQLKGVDTPAHDATWDVSTGQPVLVPAQSGNGADTAEMANSIIDVLGQSGSARRIDVRIGPLEPRLTTEQAAALNVTQQMSSFTQKFPYAAYRSQNIGEASKRINRTLLMPGETFSFNHVVGERTKANGFAEGPVVGEGGRLREDMGGGVSTAATTMWTAAFYAGLEKVEQGTHLIWLKRYQPGLEATVNWGVLDLQFKNNTPNGVFITTDMTSSSLTVSMWGTKQYDEIRAESGEKRNVTPFTKEVSSGPECVPQEGADGFDISVDRVFIKGGEEVGRETFTTGYIPAAHVECVASSSVSSGSTGTSSG